jgi:WXG100 family type VII secretion target
MRLFPDELVFPARRVNLSGFMAVSQVDPRVTSTGAKQQGACVMPNLNVTYAEMQSAASQLKAGEQQIETDLARLKQLVDSLVASGYVTDSSSKQFEASYAEFSAGATKVVQGLTGMGQYLDTAANTFQEADAQLAATLK